MKFFRDFKQKRLLEEINNRDYNFFVVYHKPFKLLKSDIVTPVHAGRLVATKKSKDGKISGSDYKWLLKNTIGDDFGENISSKNRYYCENTVTYWMWKNVKSKYVGLMHYRRIFDFSYGEASADDKLPLKTHCITKETVENLMQDYDIILPKKLVLDSSIYDQYKKYHVIKDLDFVFDLIDEKYPEMKTFIGQSYIDKTGYFYNMFFTKKEIFDDYAKWLFDILFEFDKQFTDRNDRDVYQQRAVGFLAERLTGIYFNYIIKTKNLRVKEVNVVGIEDEKKSNLYFTKFAVKNKKGKGISLFLRIKL